MDKKRILFVDDESNILTGLARMLRGMRKEIEMAFAESGREALEVMAKESFDVVVSDMRMPGMDGAELLAEVRRLYPDTMRIMLSGYAAPEAVMRTVTVVHQFLHKPCEPDDIKDTLLRCCRLRDILTNSNLRGLVSSLNNLPSLPSIYTELLDILAKEDCSVDEVADCISRDIGMSAKILQLVNSPFFGLYRNIDSASQAVGLLGLDTVKYLVLSVKIFSELEKQCVSTESIHDLMEHSMSVGAFAKQIVELETDDEKVANDAFISGMLHDVGKLVFACNMPEEYKKTFELAENEGISLQAAERQMFQADHSQIGAYLLGLWGFSVQAIEAIAFHHNPEQTASTTFDPATAVHVANVFDHEQKNRLLVGTQPTFDLDYLDRVQCSDRLDSWRDLCQRET